MNAGKPRNPFDEKTFLPSDQHPSVSQAAFRRVLDPGAKGLALLSVFQLENLHQRVSAPDKRLLIVILNCKGYQKRLAARNSISHPSYNLSKLRPTYLRPT